MATTSPYISNPGNLPTTFRVGGSGFTAFHWGGQVIGWAQQVGHQSPQPVAQPVAIQPLDQQYPMQIIVPGAVGPGTLQLQMFEIYNTKIWDQIMLVTDTVLQKDAPGKAGAQPGSIYNNLAEVFQRLSAINQPISCYKIIYPPNTGIRGGPTTKKYADKFYGCMIVDLRDDEIIQIGTMEVVKNLTIQYTFMQRISETTSNF